MCTHLFAHHISGLKTKGDVNRCLYQTLEPEGLVQNIARSGRKPEWTLRTENAPAFALPVARVVDSTPKAIIPWGRHKQTARESKPEASATFYTPTAARASAPIPQRSAAAASGGADPSPSGWSMRDQILRVMRGQPAGASMTAIEIAKRLGG